MFVTFDSSEEFEGYLNLIDEIDKGEEILYCFTDRDMCPGYHSGGLSCKECYRYYGNYEIKEVR